MSRSFDRYRFTDDQKALLTRSIELVQERHGEAVFIEFGMSQTFEGARIGFVGHEDSPLVALHSAPDPQGLSFIVLKLGPPPDLTPSGVTPFSKFAEAASAAAEAIAAIIIEAKAPFNQVAQALSDEDRTLLQRLATVVGNSAGQEGYVEFQAFAPGAEACAVGVSVKGRKIGLATFVATRDLHSFRCSVRNFQNEPVPGMPEFFPSVAHAVSAHQNYFTGIASTVRQKTVPWWQRLFG